MPLADHPRQEGNRTKREPWAEALTGKNAHIMRPSLRILRKNAYIISLSPENLHFYDKRNRRPCSDLTPGEGPKARPDKENPGPLPFPGKKQVIIMRRGFRAWNSHVEHFHSVSHNNMPDMGSIYYETPGKMQICKKRICRRPSTRVATRLLGHP